MTARNDFDPTEFAVNDIIRVQWDIDDWSFARVLDTVCDERGKIDGLQVLALDFNQKLIVYGHCYNKNAIRKATPEEIELLPLYELAHQEL